MIDSQYTKDALALFAKQGVGILQISLVRHATVTDKETPLPSCAVTVTAMDPDTNEIIEQQTADISTETPPYQEVFEIRVEPALDSLKKKAMSLFRGKEKDKHFVIDVVATPINGYQESYGEDKEITQLTFKAGSIVKKNIALPLLPTEPTNDSEIRLKIR